MTWDGDGVAVCIKANDAESARLEETKLIWLLLEVNFIALNTCQLWAISAEIKTIPG
jgi:hypothetical protein